MDISARRISIFALLAAWQAGIDGGSVRRERNQNGLTALGWCRAIRPSALRFICESARLLISILPIVAAPRRVLRYAYLFSICIA